MGLYDRDYARTEPSRFGGGGGGFDGGQGRGGGRRGGRGAGGFRNPMDKLRLWSFNTWLLVVNIAVFVIGAVAFSNTRTWVELPVGRELLVGTTEAQKKNAVILKDVVEPSKRTPGVYERPIVDPKSAETDALGRVLVDAQGRVIPKRIGTDRYTMKPPLEAFGHFSTGKGFLELEVWRLLTFQFLHANMLHLVLNMLGLFMFGPIVEEALGFKRYAAFYLVCGIFGALMYLVLNLAGNLLPASMHVPGLLFTDLYTPLVGASAGIFGVMMAAAYLAPDEEVSLFFVLPMKMKLAVYGFFLISVYSLLAGSSNAGGEAAHVGGAIAGFFFIRRPHLLRDFFDFFGRSGPEQPDGGRGGKGGRAAKGGVAASRPVVLAGTASGPIAKIGPGSEGGGGVGGLGGGGSGGTPVITSTVPMGTGGLGGLGGAEGAGAIATSDAQVDAILEKLKRSGRASLSEQELEYLEAHRRALQSRDR